MALSTGSRDNGEPGAEQPSAIVAIIETPGEKASSCSPHSWFTIALGRSYPQRKLSNFRRVEESSKARIQELHKTSPNQEVAQEWASGWEWSWRKAAWERWPRRRNNDGMQGIGCS